MSVTPSSSPSLTVVVIAYNSAAMLPETLRRLCASLERAQWPEVEVLVVNDGSTDATEQVCLDFAATTSIPVRVHTQTNQGRLAASRAGVREARHDAVVFLGERVFMHPEAFANLRRLLEENPSARVWNCHIEIPREGNPQAQFWYVLTYLGWRRYLAKPRLVNFGLDDFDYYPKGTGGFFCPRDLLQQAYDDLASVFKDEKFASDDTALIRWIADRERIWMSPDYAADYISRDDFKAFIRHSYDRGTMFLDSYLHPGTRLYRPLLAYFAGLPFVGWWMLRRPRSLAIAPVSVLIVSAVLRVLGVPGRDVRGFATLAPVFGVVFSAGLWRGLLNVVRQRWASPSPSRSTTPPN